VLVAIVGVLLTGIGIVVSVTVPEVRELFHLDPPKNGARLDMEKHALENHVRACITVG
jgi:hypothetical protein